jgi:uncharacterized protein with GYD domain
MATYIILCSYSEQGREWIALGQSDQDTARKIAEDVGAQMEHAWLTTGEYDVVIVITCDSHAQALAFAVAFGSVAGATTKTLAAEAGLDRVYRDATRAYQAHTRH